jgi:hypothetical protein
MLNVLDALRAPADHHALGVAVVLGAGRGADLDNILDHQPRRLIVVEGDGDQAAALRRRFGRRPGVEVHAEVLAPYGGPRQWHRFNLRRLDGLLAADVRLRRVYPRVQATEPSIVDTVSIGPWLDGLGLESRQASGDNLLVFDIAGSEGALLASMQEACLDPFAWVAIRSAAKPLYAGGSTLPQTRARMVQLGYRVVAKCSDEALWPVELYYAQPSIRKLARLQGRLNAVEADLVTRETELAQSQQALALARKAAESLAQQMERLRAQAGTEREQLEAQIAEATKNADEIKGELARVRIIAAHAVKLQTLREADLSDLRVRYEELHRQHQARQELLSRLGERLSAATEQFAQMATGAGVGPGPSAKDSDASVSAG